MKRRSFLFSAAGTALFIRPLHAFAANPTPIYKVGMDAAYPPFGSVDSQTGEYVGFDVDLIKAIGRMEGFDVQIFNLNFDGLIPALVTDSIQIAINDITITEDRKRNVDFSRRYCIVGMGAAVRHDNTTIRNARDLEGRRLAVTIGSTGEEAARKIKGADVRVFSQLNECYLELINGGVDAVINDTTTNDFYVMSAGRGKVKSVPLSLNEEELGITVRKGNRELLGKIDRGLSKLKKNGEYSVIFEKWFGRKPGQVLLAD